MPTRALIVDDSKTMRHLLENMLVEFSFEVLCAADGREGLATLQREWPIDLVLIDWDMPVMNGLEMVKAIRADPKYSDLKIMMVTALNTQAGIDDAMNSGADDYLMKPLTKDMVLDKLLILGLVE